MTVMIYDNDDGIGGSGGGDNIDDDNDEYS